MGGSTWNRRIWICSRPRTIWDTYVTAFVESLRIVGGDENFIDSFHGFARSSTDVLVPGFPTEARPSVGGCQGSG